MVPRTSIADRSFGWLGATQFLGALNDNVFKLLVVFFLIQLAGDEGQPAAGIVAVVGALFVLPVLVFSHVGGMLADRFSKNRVIVATKVAEIVIMILGWLAFTLHSRPALYSICALMAAQTSLFNPSKNSLIPEMVPRDWIAKANGLMVALTFLAIIIGTPLAALLSELTARRFELASLFCVAVAVAGTLVSLPIARESPHTERTPSFARGIVRALLKLRKDSYLLLTIVSSACFIMVASYMQMNLIPYGMQTLGLTQERSSYLFLLAAIGIGVSSILAGRLSGRNIEFGLVPLGAAILAASCVLLYFVHTLAAVAVVAILAGLSVGFFTVPLDSFLQIRSPKPQLGRILAISSFLGCVGILMATGLIYLTGNVLGLSAAQGFLISAGITVILTICTILVLPDFLVRFIIAVFARAIYRIKTVGIENLPTEGGALLVCNHVTFADALILGATQQRRIRFVMLRDTYEHHPLFRPICKLMRVIPISEKDPPKQLVASLKEARAALDEGYLVCIFPEGQLTRSGNLSPFKPGFTHIVKNSRHPIIPIYLGGAWGSIFSYAYGKPATSLPRRVPYPVTVIFGRPLPPETPAYALRLAICELSGKYFELQKAGSKSLGEMFVRTARRNWNRFAIGDTTGKRLTYGKTLIGSVALAGQLDGMLKGQDKVGIVFPATVGGALTNYAVTMLGKVTVNLNFTAPADAVAHAVKECGIKTVITSRKLIENLKTFTVPCEMVFIEDIMPRISGKAKMIALFKALCWPRARLGGASRASPDSAVTVIFSSGTTGRPKGAMLSHYNIISNMESFGTVLHFTPDDRMCAALPFFHSFGFTCTLWFPLVAGFQVFHHPNPLDGEKIAQVARENKSTILLATPTFLLAYIRRARPEDFASLRAVITGAEKLRTKVADAFEEKFRLAPLEGYGVTEASPVVSVNTHDVEMGGVLQLGTKKGTIGQPIPGVTVKAVGNDGVTPLPPGEEGLLLVKGPNVMLGYLNMPERTAEVIRDGWYDTGDIGKIDDDGFITITDRASRFSKIGGEMVPHIAIEEAYLKALNTEERVVVVASVPDDKRGERLIVLFVDAAGTAERLHDIISRSDLPNLWKPDIEDHIRIETMPILGSGKLDLKGVKQLAVTAATGS